MNSHPSCRSHWPAAQLAQTVAFLRETGYDITRIIIRFSNPDMERRALGYLAGRFSFKTWDNGETAVPPQALGSLAAEGISL